MSTTYSDRNSVEGLPHLPSFLSSPSRHPPPGPSSFLFAFLFRGRIVSFLSLRTPRGWVFRNSKFPSVPSTRRDEFRTRICILVPMWPMCNVWYVRACVHAMNGAPTVTVRSGVPPSYPSSIALSPPPLFSLRVGHILRVTPATVTSHPRSPLNSNSAGRFVSLPRTRFFLPTRYKSILPQYIIPSPSPSSNVQHSTFNNLQSSVVVVAHSNHNLCRASMHCHSARAFTLNAFIHTHLSGCLLTSSSSILPSSQPCTYYSPPPISITET